MQENVIKCSKSKNNSLSDLGSFIKHHFGVSRLFFFYKKICFIWKMCCLFSPMLLHNAQMKYFKLKPLLFSLKTVYVKCSWWFTVISVKPAKTSTLLSQNNVVSGFQLLTVTWNRMQRGRQGSRCASHLGCAAGGRPPPQVQGLASPCMQLHRLPFPHFSCQDAPNGIVHHSQLCICPTIQVTNADVKWHWPHYQWWCSGNDRPPASHGAPDHSPLSPRVQPDFSPTHWLLI